MLEILNRRSHDASQSFICTIAVTVPKTMRADAFISMEVCRYFGMALWAVDAMLEGCLFIHLFSHMHGNHNVFFMHGMG